MKRGMEGLILITLDMVYDAQKTLKGVAKETPIIHATKIDNNLYLKSENLQMTGSFKLRGAYYKVSTLTEEEKRKGVIAASAGNHAQGVALACTRMGVKSYICMPAYAPLAKVEATKSYGGEPILVQGSFDDAAAEAKRLIEEKGYTFVAPFEDEKVIAGQGTIGLEVLEQLPDVDTVVVPIGGGGLISGVAYAIKQLKPQCKVIGVQALATPCMAESRKAGHVVKVQDAPTIADGIHVLQPGNITFDLCQKYVDEIVTVTEDEIAVAILTLMEKQKTVAEGAGATAVAAVLSGKVDTKDQKVCCIVSGGNIDVTMLNRVITRGLITTGRLTEFTTKLPDMPGALVELSTVIASVGANIVNVQHERESIRSKVNECVIYIVVETRDIAHKEEVISTLKKAGYVLL